MDKRQYSEFYRPKTLQAVVGQEHAVAQIEGMFKRKSIPSTILITGITSSGKTSIARILANRIIEAKHIVNQHPDINEESVGTERGIDFIREIVRRAQYAPSNAKYSVFILDEIAKATSAAFSPLLKLLEEPPKQTVFILMTDEPEKLPTTILNRCYRIDLLPLTKSDIKKILQRVVKQEKITLESSVIKKIIKLAESPRNALQMLQAVHDAGGDIKAINQTITAMQGTGIIAVKILVALYEKKIELLFSNLLLDHDIVDLINQLLRYNEWLMRAGTKGVFVWNDANTAILKKRWDEGPPKKDRLTHTHNVLINIRNVITTMSTFEQKHLILARLGSLIHTI